MQQKKLIKIIFVKVIYHVATLMPTNREKDPSGNKKKRHIGNNFVAIVYNDTR